MSSGLCGGAYFKREAIIETWKNSVALESFLQVDNALHLALITPPALLLGPAASGRIGRRDDDEAGLELLRQGNIDICGGLWSLARCRRREAEQRSIFIRFRHADARQALRSRSVP